jgi:membrane protease YdiL (CAAX protease family)
MAPEKKTEYPNNRELSELRIPVFILFIAAVTLTHILSVPVWIALLATVPYLIFISLKMERKLMFSLLKIKCIHSAAAPLVGIIIYGIFDSALQMISSSSIGNGLLKTGESLPLIFTWLLILRASFADIPPVVAGLAGGVLLSFSEELFWRGLLQTRIIIHLGHGMAILISSVLYGLFYFLILGPLAGIMSLFLGIVYATLTYRSRSIVPAILVHFVLMVLFLWIKPNIAALF